MTSLARRVAWLMVVGVLVVSAVTLWVDGRVPASVPGDAPALRVEDLSQALEAVNGSGHVSRAGLTERKASLERYLAALAATSPKVTPEVFPTPEARLAFWLNAWTALVLEQLLVRGPPDAWARAVVARPIGGQWLTLAAIERRVFREAGDARVWLVLFDGTEGGGVLDGAPWAPELLEAQLNEGARRFMQRPGNVKLTGQTVQVSSVLLEHAPDFLAALPEDRRNLLQVVWAFLPDTCERTGCDTRGDLDHACGLKLERCAVVPAPGLTSSVVQ
jgi:hypothetical protein